MQRSLFRGSFLRLTLAHRWHIFVIRCYSPVGIDGCSGSSDNFLPTTPPTPIAIDKLKKRPPPRLQELLMLTGAITHFPATSQPIDVAKWCNKNIYSRRIAGRFTTSRAIISALFSAWMGPSRIARLCHYSVLACVGCGGWRTVEVQLLQLTIHIDFPSYNLFRQRSVQSFSFPSQWRR